MSLVDPNGVLTIGVTSEDMIKGKERSELLRSYEEREEGVKGFVESLARGFKNNLRIVEIGEKKVRGRRGMLGVCVCLCVFGRIRC